MAVAGCGRKGVSVEAARAQPLRFVAEPLCLRRRCGSCRGERRSHGIEGRRSHVNSTLSLPHALLPRVSGETRARPVLDRRRSRGAAHCSEESCLEASVHSDPAWWHRNSSLRMLCHTLLAASVSLSVRLLFSDSLRNHRTKSLSSPVVKTHLHASHLF